MMNKCTQCNYSLSKCKTNTKKKIMIMINRIFKKVCEVMKQTDRSSLLQIEMKDDDRDAWHFSRSHCSLI